MPNNKQAKGDDAGRKAAKPFRVEVERNGGVETATVIFDTKPGAGPGKDRGESAE